VIAEIAGAAIIGTIVSALAGAIGYFLRDLRDQLHDIRGDVDKNSQFRRVMTGEEIEAHKGELPEIEESFSEVTEEIEELRREQTKEHRKVWEALHSIHDGVDRLVEAMNGNDKIEATVEKPEHPFEYRSASNNENNTDD